MLKITVFQDMTSRRVVYRYEHFVSASTTLTMQIASASVMLLPIYGNKLQNTRICNMFLPDTRVTDNFMSKQIRKTNISQQNIFLPILGSSRQKSIRESSLIASTLPTFQLRTVRGKMAMGPNTYNPLLIRNPTCNKHFLTILYSENCIRTLNNPQSKQFK